ncbi:copper resistance protein B [Hyphobacterium indicum]|uniref:copper resistance protein B n=1 Tax=Hyphobacterium indicum TaxID=2162714 RepID=UPI000D65E3FB|nr:copper resistance protein B [Hyphobacterium indicum]
MRATLLFTAAAVIAGSGAAHAQDYAHQFYPPEEMEQSFEELRHETGGQRQFFFQTDRFEYQVRDDEETLLWDINAWYGGRLNRLWIKSEAEYSFDHGAFEEARVEALWSRAISPYFDVQGGLAHDFEDGNGRTHAVAALQGLAPYWFEVDVSAYLSDRGELTGSAEAEYELLLTQRLILQPRAELAWSAEDIPSLETGAGFTSLQAGLRLRYEIVRQFAPYVGVEWTRQLGETADYARAAGVDPESTAIVAGVRVWF